jgi:hypothetical protein
MVRTPASASPASGDFRDAPEPHSNGGDLLLRNPDVNRTGAVSPRAKKKGWALLRVA